MHLSLLFHRFRWLHLPTTFLVMLLQRTPVLRLLATEGPGFSLQPADILKSAFALAALSAYDSVAGATVFNAIPTSPTTVTPASGAANSSFTASGVTNSAFSLAFTVTGAPQSSNSWKVTGSFPPGLTVTNGTATTGGYLFNGITKVVLAGTPTAATTSNLTFTAYRNANASGDSAKITCSITIASATPTAPVFTAQPSSQSVTAGNSVTFTATVTGSPAPTLQWYKNGSPLSGKTAPTLTLANVRPVDSGDYLVVATNSAAPSGIGSSTATLTVNYPPVFSIFPFSQTVGLGSAVTLVSEASGLPAPTYVWRKNGILLAGQTGPSLTLDPVTFADTGTYLVTAVNSVSTRGVAAPAATLAVIVPAPAAIVDPGTLCTGSEIDWDLSGGAPVPSGLVYKAAGLPAGLKLASATGHITGVITAGAGTAKLSTWAQAGATKSVINLVTLAISAFPSALVGSSEALLRTPGDDALPAGKITLKIAPNGTFTGQLLADDVSAFTLRGRLALAPDNTSASATLTLSRGKLLPAYTLALVVSSAAPSLTATLSANAAPLGLATDGARLAAQAPTGAAGPYTLLLAAPASLGSVGAYPLGSGYATATINATGTLILGGKNADGTKLTGSCALGADNTYRLYAKPYATQAGGYVAGALSLAARADNAARWHVAADSGSDIYWRKPDPLAFTTNYADGFGPLALTARLEPWTKLSATTPLPPLLGLGDAGDLTVTLAADSLANDATDPYGLPKTLHLSAANAFSVIGDNTAARFTAKVVPATGALSGGFTLQALPPLAKRTVTYSGVILQPAPADQPGLVGGGFFLLPAASSGDPVLSGRIEFTTP